MRKTSITFFCCCILLFATLCFGCSMPKSEYLRIHIRANSNDNCDQVIKYEIRDLIVKNLTPKLKNCTSKTQAINVLNNNESAVKELIDSFLKEKGFNYSCKLSIREENFPTRVYEGLTLEAGYYDALIIELGNGAGDNWWCVVYPPLCFRGSEDIEYRSKIIDLINGLGNSAIAR